MRGQRGRQRREVLILAFAAKNDRHLAAQSLQGGQRGPDIGALGVVEIAHATDFSNEFDAMCQPGEAFQRRQQTLRRDVDGFAQRQRRHGVGGVVQAVDAQFFQTEQRFRAAHDAAALQPVIAGQAGEIQAESDDPSPLCPSGFTPGQATGIVAVDDHHPLTLEDPRLGCRVGVHAAVAVEMILADVKHRGRVGIQRVSCFELEAGKFEHPDRRRGKGEGGRVRLRHLTGIAFLKRCCWQGRIGSDRFSPSPFSLLPSLKVIHQGIKGRGRDIAAGDGRDAAVVQEMRGQRGGRCLAVTAADRQDSGIGQQGTHALGEEFDFGNHWQATRQSLLHHGFRERNTGRNGDEFDALKQIHGKRACQ